MSNNFLFAASTAPTFQFSSNTGAGDATAAPKPALNLFGTPATSAPAGGFTFGTAAAAATPKTTAGQTFGSITSVASSIGGGSGFGFSVPASTTSTTTGTEFGNATYVIY